MSVSLKVRGGVAVTGLFEKIMSLVFWGLNETFHFSDQSLSLIISRLSWAEVSSGFVPDANKVVSSANIIISLSKPSIISFI